MITKEELNDLRSEERAKTLIIEFLKISGENLSSLAKKIGIDPPSLYNFINEKSSMTFRTFSKVEDYILEELKKSE